MPRQRRHRTDADYLPDVNDWNDVYPTADSAYFDNTFVDQGMPETGFVTTVGGASYSQIDPSFGH